MKLAPKEKGLGGFQEDRTSDRQEATAKQAWGREKQRGKVCGSAVEHLVACVRPCFDPT